MIRCILLLVLCASLASTSRGQVAADSYLQYARTFADRLLATAIDTVGDRETAMWASVIHAPSGKIPSPGESVPPTEGTRAHDRAIWGSNLYHDLGTLRLFITLSEITGDPAYRDAAHAYVADYLRCTQHPETGLLGWGEHMYYHFYEDTVAVEEGAASRYPRYHEFLGETPPWPLLWQIDSARTRRAIEGLRYHFRGFQTQSFLFNRHAYWIVHEPGEDWQRHQFQRDGQPWIKHSGLLSYSFQFLHAKTGQLEWARWAEGVGELYWRHRDPATNLIVSCIDDQRPHTRLAHLTGTSQLAYWLFKGWQENPAAGWAKEEALALIKAIEGYSWDARHKVYRGHFEIDGRMADEEVVPVFITGYGNVSLLRVGQFAAYFARHTPDPVFPAMLGRIAHMAEQASLPDDFVINSLAEVLHFYLDAYELLGEAGYLQKARRYADIGIEKLWRNDLLVRQPGDEYYEAKLGTGRFALGLLRLHLELADHPMRRSVDWSP